MPGPDFGKTWNNENCYAYAINRTGVTKDPGRGDFIESDVVNPTKLRKAVSADGAILFETPQQTPATGAKADHYLIAVKCDTKGINYHAIRRDESTGIWYSKTPLTAPGRYQAGAFQPIENDWNPRDVLSRTGMLMVWIGYYWVPNAGL